MYTCNDFQQGQHVYFGRPNGEKTLGKIVKLHAKKAKVKTLENRGRYSPAGAIWGVPYSMLTPTTDQPQPTSNGETHLPIPIPHATQNAVIAMTLDMLAKCARTGKDLNDAPMTAAQLATSLRNLADVVEGK